MSALIPPPASEQELLQRARALAGLSLAALAERAAQTVPAHLHAAKGWTGQLIEQALGAVAGSRPQPDFAHLAIELKTLPLRPDGTAKESTYVCTVPLQGETGVNWRASWVSRKLRRVLWLPVEADPAIPVAQRRIGMAILWSPSPQDDRMLQQDWEEIMELVGTGRIDELSARLGTYLQVRPKAADRRALTHTTDADGQRTLTLPRGFYLRTTFTNKILREHYV